MLCVIICIYTQVYKILESESFSSQTEWMGRAEVGRVEILLKSISQKKNVYKRFKFSATKVSFMPFITYTYSITSTYGIRNLCFTSKMTQQNSKYKNSNYWVCMSQWASPSTPFNIIIFKIMRQVDRYSHTMD